MKRCVRGLVSAEQHSSGRLPPKSISLAGAATAALSQIRVEATRQIGSHCGRLRPAGMRGVALLIDPSRERGAMGQAKSERRVVQVEALSRRTHSAVLRGEPDKLGAHECHQRDRHIPSHYGAY
jgi:hypothetical protein